MWNLGNSHSPQSGELWAAGSEPTQVEDEWIGNTVFNAQTPILVIKNPSDSNVRAKFDHIWLWISNTPGGFVSYKVLADRIDRYVLLSGTLHNNGNANARLMRASSVFGPSPAKSSGILIYDEQPDYEATSFTNSLANNVGGTTAVASFDQHVEAGTLAAAAGANVRIPLNGSLVLEPGCTAAVYAWAATTAPRGFWSAKWIEEKVNLNA